MGKFTSETDSAILEDASGRISIRSTEQFNCNNFVTGSIVALLGHVDQAGYFICEDHCFAGIPFKDSLPPQVSLSKKRGLFDQLGDRKFIAFASGLNFGSDDMTAEYMSQLAMLARFFQGNHLNTQWNSLSSRI